MADLDTRVAVLEERQAQEAGQFKDDIAEIKDTMRVILRRQDELFKIANMGKGALWIVLKWGGIAAALVAVGALVGEKIERLFS